jgi:hypothetical protein
VPVTNALSPNGPVGTREHTERRQVIDTIPRTEAGPQAGIILIGFNFQMNQWGAPWSVGASYGDYDRGDGVERKER